MVKYAGDEVGVFGYDRDGNPLKTSEDIVNALSPEADGPQDLGNKPDDPSVTTGTADVPGLAATAQGLSIENTQRAFLDNARTLLGDQAQGMDNDALKEYARAVQQALIDAGVEVKGGADGKIGPNTKAAIAQWAEQNPGMTLEKLIQSNNAPKAFAVGENGMRINEHGVWVNGDGMPVDESGMEVYGVTVDGKALVPGTGDREVVFEGDSPFDQITMDRNGFLYNSAGEKITEQPVSEMEGPVRVGHPNGRGSLTIHPPQNGGGIGFEEVTVGMDPAMHPLNPDRRGEVGKDGALNRLPTDPNSQDIIAMVASNNGHGAYHINSDGDVLDADGKPVNLKGMDNTPANVFANRDGSGIQVTDPDGINTMTLYAQRGINGEITVSATSTEVYAAPNGGIAGDKAYRLEGAFGGIPGVEEIKQNSSLSFNHVNEGPEGIQIVGDMTNNRDLSIS